MTDIPKILVIDDQIGREDGPGRQNFVDSYGDLDYEMVFSTAEETPGKYSVAGALAAIEEHSDAALIILDIKFGRETDRLGVDILRETVIRYPDIPVVMMTSLEAEPATVVKCMRLGARDYVTKGITPEDLAGAIEKHARRVTQSHLILGDSAPFQDLRALIGRAAQNGRISVLILGERGTGKELVARSIHFLGPRRNAPFVAVNCAGLPKDILSAELFGAEKGAFTGAHQTKYGYLELANGGVLFLDEVGAAPLEVQTSLLRVLETRRFRRLGVSTDEIEVDFQLVCATNGNLADLVAQGKFRADLYDRIRGVEICTPALRQCRQDIPLLGEHWLHEILEATGGTSYHVEGFTPEAVSRLMEYDWPGNVRELKNVIEGAMIRADGPRIELDDLPAEVARDLAAADNAAVSLPADGADIDALMAAQELEHLRSAFLKAGRNKARTMRLYYPNRPANYFDRIVYDAVKRAPDVLPQFPELRDAFEKERRRRERNP